MDYFKNQFVDFIIKVMIYPLIYYLPSMFYFLNNDSFSIGRIRNCINSLISVLEKKGVKICNRKRMFDFNEIQNSGCFFCTIAFSVVVLISKHYLPSAANLHDIQDQRQGEQQCSSLLEKMQISTEKKYPIFHV